MRAEDLLAGVKFKNGQLMWQDGDQHCLAGIDDVVLLQGGAVIEFRFSWVARGNKAARSWRWDPTAELVKRFETARWALRDRGAGTYDFRAGTELVALYKRDSPNAVPLSDIDMPRFLVVVRADSLDSALLAAGPLGVGQETRAAVVDTHTGERMSVVRLRPRSS